MIPSPSILFVCTGNICRSPTADALTKHYARKHNLLIQSDSAAIQNYHTGSPPHPQSLATALAYDITEIKNLRARQVQAQDFHDFNLILAMSREHEYALKSACPAALQHKIQVFLPYCGITYPIDTPDPWGKNDQAFHDCFHLIDRAILKLLRLE